MSERALKHEDYHTVWARVDGHWCKRCERFLHGPCGGKGCDVCDGKGYLESEMLPRAPHQTLEEELAAAEREQKRLNEARWEAILDWEKAGENVARIRAAIQARDAARQSVER